MHRIALALILLALALPAAAADLPSAALARLESGWARANFQLTDGADKLAALDELLAASRRLQQQAPQRAEPLIWQGVLLTAKAGVVRGLAGYRLVLEARDQLLRAEAIEPAAAGGLGLIQLGILYHEVPGPPLAFGDRRKAAAYLQRALALDPQGLAENLAMAQFLAKGSRYAEAEPLLLTALQAPIRPDQRVADLGRRADAETLLKLVRSRLGRSG